MRYRGFRTMVRTVGLTVTGLLLVAACAPAGPAPTAAPAKPTEAPAKPTEAPKAAAPAPTTAPAAEKPAAAKPAAKVDTKAIADFYQGKTVRIIVGFEAGGGYDTYARLIGRHLGKHIPGNPNVIVENQPGAGSLISANNLYKSAPKDGTVMAHFIGGQITQKIIVNNPAVEFEPAELNYIGGPTPDTPACAVRKESGFTSLEQVRNKELVLGGLAPGSTTNDIPNTLKAALGLNIKLVEGYGGTSKVRLAADGGEVMGGCWGWESIKPTWKDGLEKGEVVVIGQGGPQPHPDLRDVPMMQSMAKNDDERKLIEAGITVPGQISRLFAMPPGVAMDRVEAMREAFMTSLQDPALLDEAKRSSIDISPIPPEEMYARIKELQELAPELKAKLKDALGT
jgi:tripartite-type tricarboxylate transporter receptor subunit TctC